MKIEESVHDAIDSTVRSLGYEIVAVEYRKIGEDMHLTVFCDCCEGKGVFGLDDCVRINDAIDDILEQLNPTSDKPYVLNVSSPGLDRPLRTERDYQRNIGKGVDIKLHQHVNRKTSVQGTLSSITPQEIVVNTSRGDIAISIDNIRQATPWVRFK
jgi:ribosome maturation factor RimP